MTKKEKVAHIRSRKRTCRGPLTEAGRKTVNELLERGDLAAAAKADQANRKGCGADFNKIVVAGPWDGKQHEYTCPECGVSGHYTAPVFAD